MSGFYEKLWFQQNSNRVATARAKEQIQKTGLSLPCKVVAVSGQMVTVSFEVETSTWSLPEITIPKAEGPWNYTPTQVGDYGYTSSADVYLGGISGQGGGTADFSKRGNLGSTLVWFPVGSKSFSPLDQDAGLSQGPNGWTLQTSDGNSQVTVDQSGITLKFGSKTVVLNSSGLVIDGVLFDSHTHLYSPGSGTPTDTGGPQ